MTATQRWTLTVVCAFGLGLALFTAMPLLWGVADWRAIFLINLPLGVGAALAAACAVATALLIQSPARPSRSVKLAPDPAS